MTFTTKIWSLWIGSNPWEFSWISHRFLKSINKHLIIFCCNVFVWKSGLGEMIAPGSDIIMNPPLIKHAAKYTSSKLSKCELCRIQFIFISRVYYSKRFGFAKLISFKSRASKPILPYSACQSNEREGITTVWSDFNLVKINLLSVNYAKNLGGLRTQHTLRSSLNELEGEF